MLTTDKTNVKIRTFLKTRGTIYNDEIVMLSGKHKTCILI